MTPAGLPTTSIYVVSEDIWTMLLSTFRYSLGRSTFMPNEAVELYKRYGAVLTTQQQRQIVKEVRDEVDRAEYLGHFVGMKCDHDVWIGFLRDQDEGTHGK